MRPCRWRRRATRAGRAVILAPVVALAGPPLDEAWAPDTRHIVGSRKLGEQSSHRLHAGAAGEHRLVKRLLSFTRTWSLSVNMVWADLGVTQVGWSARQRAAQSMLKRAAVQPKIDLHREPGVLDRVGRSPARASLRWRQTALRE